MVNRAQLAIGAASTRPSTLPRRRRSTADAVRLARGVLDEHWDGILPVRPEVIGRALGVQVVPDPALAGDGISGQFAHESGIPVCRYNPREPVVRQRFTVAHELGHFALGHEGMRDPTRNFSATNYDPREAAANRFAAELLMPESAVNELIERRRIRSLRELARRFAVSDVAMEYRLKNLGWLS